MRRNDSLELPDLLVVSLKRPTKLYLGNGCVTSTMEFCLGADNVIAEDTPWGSRSDLLIDATNRVLVGLTFEIRPRSQNIYQWIRGLDSPIIRLRDPLSPHERWPPGYDYFDEYFLEIQWFAAKALTREMALLEFGDWYWLYPGEGLNPNASHAEVTCSPPVACIVKDLQRLEREFNVRLPTDMGYPALEFSYK